MTPCTTCGASGLRGMGTETYCALHLSEFYATLHAHAWDGHGIGLIAGPERPDVLVGGCDLLCSLCGATWVGAPFDPCGWCAARIANQVAHQVEILLTPPETTPDTHARMMLTWAERLDRAIDAGLITQQQAERAMRRELDRAA